jgi:D-xylose reductase
MKLNHRSLKDVWRQMEKAIEQGLCRAIGISNFTCQAMINLLQFAKVRPAVVQLESNPYCLQDDLINFIKKFGMHVQAYSPLCRGGKDQKLLFGEKNDIFGEISLKELAEKYMKSVAQVILNWNLCRGVSFVVKTDKYERLAVNWDITNFELQEEDRYVVSGLDKSQRSFNPKMHPFWKGIDPLA